MLVQNFSYSNAYLNRRMHFGVDRGPRMLKDCLLEDSNSCSSNGFKSFPRRPINPCPVKPEQKSNVNTMTKKKKKTIGSLSSGSRTLQAVINAVIMAPSVLPKILSWRLSKKDDKRQRQTEKAEVTVRVKDIVRWRSSRDLNKNVSPDQLDSTPSQPHHHTTINIVITTANSTTSSSSTRSSWCDSDFTSEFSPSCGGNSEEHGEKDFGTDREKEELPCDGQEDSPEATAATVADTQVGPTQEGIPCEGVKDHCSPVSILDLQYEEDDQSSDSSFSRSLDNVERTGKRLKQKIKRFESQFKISPYNLNQWMSDEEDSCSTEGGLEADVNVDDDDDDDDEGEEELDEFEEKAGQLWNQVKEGRAIWIHEEHLVMDFFRDELGRRMNSYHEAYRDQAFENELVEQAKAWIQREKATDVEQGSVEQRRRACVRDMEREDGKWKQMEEEQEEVGIEIRDGLFNLLMDEMLTDLYLC